MGYGILTPLVIKTQRRCLGRPSLVTSASLPSPTGMIEDLAAVEERYLLAQWLGVDPDLIPTNAVSYTLPFEVWVPVVLEDAYDIPGSLKYAGDGKFLFFCRGNQDEVDVSVGPNEAHAFMEGRIKEDVRPLCYFNRPGAAFHLRRLSHIYSLY
jgi:hypothetical protein